MSALQVFGVVAGAATLVGLPLAVYYGRRIRPREKILVFESGGSVFPIASAKSLADYSLSIVYQPRDRPEERIEAAYVAHLRFANFGREPIRREDIAPREPLMVVAKGARVLDLSLLSVRRDVTGIDVEPPEFGEEGASARLTFDFLDYLDGAVIRAVSTGPDLTLSLVGSIVGMPAGTKTPADFRRSGIWGKIGGALIAVAFLTTLSLTPFIYRWVTGAWNDAWLLALPVLALLLPMVVILTVVVVLPGSSPSYPPELSIPHQFSRLATIRHDGPGPASVWLEPGDALEIKEDWHAGRHGEPGS